MGDFNTFKWALPYIIGFVIGYTFTIRKMLPKRKLLIQKNKNAHYFNLENARHDPYMRPILYKYNQYLLRADNNTFKYGQDEFFFPDTHDVCYTDDNNGLHYCICGSKDRTNKIYLKSMVNPYLVFCLDSCIPMFLNSAHLAQENTNKHIITIFTGHYDKNSYLNRIPKDIIKLILSHLYISTPDPNITKISETLSIIPNHYNKKFIIDQGFDLHISFNI